MKRRFCFLDHGPYINGVLFQYLVKRISYINKYPRGIFNISPQLKKINFQYENFIKLSKINKKKSNNFLNHAKKYIKNPNNVPYEKTKI